ncbi:penicillin acylase family protein [Bordetella sp. N]|uniref:bifunctional acylase PvdQ n=1 Tax=Bordetella sp. N TaxID=1746199 RepID=UPI00071042FB|nr:penicillin acylase family protein [Bordetella sp. N]ALM82679.1 hypothetical protein ASB57_06670 [Bordetella sp. N]
MDEFKQQAGAGWRRCGRGRGYAIMGMMVALWAGAPAARAAPVPAAGTVEIRRTAYGIPHILAHDDHALGYGIGYAYAQDNGCLLADEIITVTGQRSRYFGAAAPAGDGTRNVDSDFFYRWLNDPAALTAVWERQPAAIQALVRGYAAGYEHWRQEAPDASGANAGAGACRNQPWVRAVTADDIMALMRRLQVHAGLGQFARAVVAAQAPAAVARPGTRSDTKPDTHAAAGQATLPDWQAFSQQYGSNALAVGKDLSANGKGLLLGNPHFPWQGPLRFYQMHLTIPGEVDVMGASLAGVPVINIGYNQGLAWTHTVDSARHFTLYRLKLDPRDPMRYLVDGKPEALKPVQVTVQARGDDGAIHPVTHTFYESRYGPVLTVPGKLPWDTGQAYAMRDANLDNWRFLKQWYEINRATSVAALRASLQQTLGIPWVNTVAADSTGQTWLGTLSVVPGVDDAKLRDCAVAPAQGPLIVLDGARSACAWEGKGGGQDGIMAPASLPALARTDFVQNGNDSAWMSNPAAPLTGYPALANRQDTALGARARYALHWLAGRGERAIAPADLRGMLMSNRVYLADLADDGLARFCAAPADGLGNDNGRAKDDAALLAQACQALRSWDHTARRDSTLGYAYFAAGMQALRGLPQAWAQSFDPHRPLTTPTGLNAGDPAVAAALRQALIDTARQLKQAGMGPDTRWGDIQISTRGKQRIPIGGGLGDLGVYNATQSGALPDGRREVTYGSSYIQLVSFTAEGPRAQTVMTYSEASDPASPYAADQTLLYSGGGWVDVPYTEQQIRADPHYRSTVLRVQP